MTREPPAIRPRGPVALFIHLLVGIAMIGAGALSVAEPYGDHRLGGGAILTFGVAVVAAAVKDWLRP